MKENKNTYCVYKHTNKIDGKVYIGQTKHGDNPYKRWGYNAWGYNTASHFSNAIKKYGWDNFEHEILHNNLTIEEANYYEKLEIKNYNSTDPNFGYNQTSGGLNGERTPDVKENISKILSNYYKENPVPKERNIRRGKSIKKFWDSEESIKVRESKSKKISKSLTGIKQNRDPTKENKNKGRIKINNGIETKAILPEELNNYLNNGWKLGYKNRILPATTGKISITNGKQNKFILPEELKNYELQGWHKGKTYFKDKRQ